MSYRRRSSPLHSARAGAGAAYCLALACAALVLDNPLALGAVTVTILAAGAGARVWADMRHAALFAIPLAIVIALVNALVTRDGLTVIVRLGQLPILGHTDITLEATAYGAILGLRAMALILCGALYTAAVDPDAVLRLFRRVSFRSALTATLATRMVPMLVRDSRNLSEAQRCRPGRPPSRFALLRATSSNLFDRALDVAAALEVRGYGSARRPSRSRQPYSRHDLLFSASALSLLAVAVGARIADLAPLRAYPTLHVGVGAGAIGVAVALLVCAAFPFFDRRGIER